MQNWLLPEYIEDVLPRDAWHLEQIRRRLLDLFRSHGYEFVIPPMLEYLESLLTGTGHDMDLDTFKLVDQLSGRLMGIRADITPQAARIDAHLLNRQGITRLCYAGSVLHTLPAGMMQTREPIQVGAELYGHEGIEADLEIHRLLLLAFERAGLDSVHLDIGHVGIFRALVEKAKVDAEMESALFNALQVKDKPTLSEMTAGMDPAFREAILALPELYGDSKVLDEAAQRLPKDPQITQALQDLRILSQSLVKTTANVCFDLSDLRGYHYHSGVVFAAYAPGIPAAIGLGGRYDKVGKAFGRARSATGFSIDLRALARIIPVQPGHGAILAPYNTDSSLQDAIESLRLRGEIVIVDLPGHEAHRDELACDRKLVKNQDGWEVVEISKATEVRQS